MLKLQMFGTAFGLPDPSPFAMKGEMLLKLAGVEYTTEIGDVRKAPKGKMPVLIDGDTAIPDTTFIRFHLEDTHGIDFDKGLSARDRGIAWSVEKMLEESLYFAVMHERWAIDENFDRGPRMFFDSIPAPVRGILVRMIRKQVIRNLWGQGTGRHSRAEICRLAARILASLSDVMGDNKYLMGSHTCGADASVFPFVAGSLCPVFDSEVLTHARSHKNLVDYNQRMMAEFYPDLA
ncbi:MAG: glutathione S-transferase family protein [Pseudomonadota bacterium]